MPKRVSEFPTGANGGWKDEWFDGDIWKFDYGTDFKVKPASFRANILAEAKRRNLKVKTRLTEKSVFMAAIEG